MKLQTRITIAAGLLLPPAWAVDSLVDLDYSKYQGREIGNGITEWLAMRYAAPPIGDLRFAPAQDPEHNDTVQDATDWGYKCLRTGSAPSNIGKTHSEDCLFINVFAPSNASATSELPVFFFIQGGGFNELAHAKVNGSGLITAGDMDMVVVTLNYRVGPYGFLVDGDQVTPNIGLLDQRKALQWVQRHVSRFGGDPGHVVMGGASAGAASVSLQLSAYGGVDEGLFHAVAAESVSFATVLTVKQSHYQYENFTARVGCVGKDSLACLRSKTAQELQEANHNIPYPGSSTAPLYMWNPVVDGDLIPDITYNLFKQGRFIKVPAIFGDDTNGATIFVPRNTSTLAESNAFIRAQFPFLTLEQLGEINDLYPNQNDTCPSPGCYWRQASDAYGDLRYTCPALYISSAFTRFNQPNSWSYRYNVEDPDQMAQGVGVPHTAEIHAIFGPGNGGWEGPASYYEGEENYPAVSVVQAYWASFIRSYDPNKFRHSESVEWKPWTDATKNRIVFETAGKTRMEEIGKDLEKKCGYITSIGTDIRQLFRQTPVLVAKYPGIYSIQHELP